MLKNKKSIVLYSASPMLLILGLVIAGGIYYYSLEPRNLDFHTNNPLDVGAHILGDTDEITLTDVIGEKYPYTFSEDDLNDMATKALEGSDTLKKYLTSITLEVISNKLLVTVALFNDMKVDVVIKTKDKNTNFDVVDVDIKPDTLFVNASENLLKKALQEGADELLGQNRDYVHSFEFVDGEVIVYFNVSAFE